MDKWSLSTQEIVLLAAAGLVFIIIPGWLKSLSNRRNARRTGYSPQRQGVNPGAVFLGLVPFLGIALAWALLSTYLLITFHEQLPPKLVEGSPFIFFLLDIFVMIVSIHHCMPRGYMDQMSNTPKGLHSPLDWLVGGCMAIVLLGSMAMQLSVAFSVMGGE